MILNYTYQNLERVCELLSLQYVPSYSYYVHITTYLLLGLKRGRDRPAEGLRLIAGVLTASDTHPLLLWNGAEGPNERTHTVELNTRANDNSS